MRGFPSSRPWVKDNDQGRLFGEGKNKAKRFFIKLNLICEDIYLHLLCKHSYIRLYNNQITCLI